jgi:uncharacterized protein (DUF1015 family)
LVATRPIYTYKKNVLKAKLEENPFTFLRIINPEYNSTQKTQANSIERFENVREKYLEFKKRNILFQEEKESIYIYKQTINQHEFLGVIAGASVEEYAKDLIKKHEATITSREEMFTNYLEVVGFNAEPVLLSYPANDELDNFLIKLTKEIRQEYEFSTTDEVKHELWVLSEKESTKIIQLFSKIQATYIADGHHRSASSARLNQKLPKTKTSNHDFFLAFFIDERRLRILEFNRLVKSVQNLELKKFITLLKENFELIELSSPEKPAKEHEIVMNFKNNWFKLVCKSKIIDENHPVNCLDAEILTKFILQPILKIEDLKTDSNIEFVSGNLGIKGISNPIKNNKADLGFILFPVSINQVKKVADHAMIMPPKSTWVEPKLRSGLTIYEIEK